MSQPLTQTLRQMMASMELASGAERAAMRLLLNESGAVDLLKELTPNFPMTSIDAKMADLSNGQVTLYGVACRLRADAPGIRLVVMRGTMVEWDMSMLYGAGRDPIGFNKPARV